MMIIKQAELETVCGITSKLPENAFAGGGICRKIQCGEIFPDQRAAEPEITGENFFTAG